jgi:hypothetical protein
MARLILLGVTALALAACDGSGDDADPGSPAPATVTLSGEVTFDLVPAVAGRGLDYAATVARPARGVTIELLRNGVVEASTTTDASGRYTFAAPMNADVSLRVRAEMLRIGSPSWDFRVVDNVNGDALYTLAGSAFNTGGGASLTRNLHAPSGWSGAAYTAARSAAPFAILDVLYDAAQLVLTAAPGSPFPALRVNWSPQNVPVAGTAPGEIGSSRYQRDEGMFLVGAANQDTDEYDRHVIAHEFAHYLEHRFARSDSIGGPHALTDQLDMRLAFSEAWASAFAAMVTRESVYTDAHGTGQARDFSFDLEQRPSRTNPNPGWFNEESLQSLLYDLYDNGRDVPPGTFVVDDLALGFEPIWAVLTNEQRDTRALATVFPFVNALRTRRAADQTLIDVLTASQRIAPVTDDYGTTQTNYGIPAGRTPQEVALDFDSVYDVLAVGGPAVNVCSLVDFTSSLTGAENKLASRRFLRFSVAVPGAHTFTARAVAPLNAPADPDLRLHVGSGQVVASEQDKSQLCSVNAPQECVETFTQTLAAGDYVLEVYEWTNTNAVDDADYPPIGRTCFDVTVTP